jgi:hypothetical protein
LEVFGRNTIVLAHPHFFRVGIRNHDDRVKVIPFHVGKHAERGGQSVKMRLLKNPFVSSFIFPSHFGFGDLNINRTSQSMQISKKNCQSPNTTLVAKDNLL